MPRPKYSRRTRPRPRNSFRSTKSRAVGPGRRHPRPATRKQFLHDGSRCHPSPGTLPARPKENCHCSTAVAATRYPPRPAKRKLSLLDGSALPPGALPARPENFFFFYFLDPIPKKKYFFLGYLLRRWRHPTRAVPARRKENGLCSTAVAATRCPPRLAKRKRFLLDRSALPPGALPARPENFFFLIFWTPYQKLFFPKKIFFSGTS